MNYSLLDKIVSTEEVYWTNPQYQSFEQAIKKVLLTGEDVQGAKARLDRFAPYIAMVFPETQKTNGIIESALVEIPRMKDWLEKQYDQQLKGKLLLKCDSHLPISGSVKARGGIYEVLKHAEELAIRHKLLREEENYAILATSKFKEFFSQFSVAVGSTGNLGLSIGLIGSKLGFKVTVHMSADAKEWKKELLKSQGVHVIEYQSDYSKAVEEGRNQCQKDPDCYFIDDENSQNLFLGYAVAGSRLKRQLEESDIIVDQDHPLFVYLPCGVGGGPGGIAFGLKLLFKDNVHCFFAEPTHAPSMLLGLMTGLHQQVSVQDFGIDNKTEADGLAVGRPSGFVSKMMENLLSGIYTVNDQHLYILLRGLTDTEKIMLEPSALAGFPGPIGLFNQSQGQKYLYDHSIGQHMENAAHIVWATGGSLVPKHIMDEDYQKGALLRTSPTYPFF